MNRETAEHVAELAALLARHPYTLPREAAPGAPAESRVFSPCPPHVAARNALILCDLAHKAHRYAERMCNEDLGEKAIETRLAMFRKRLAHTLAAFGLCGSLQMDPRGWPIAIHASEADREGWETCGSPRELLRVTPHA